MHKVSQGYMAKLARQTCIMELLEQEPLANQEEIRKRLVRHGFRVNQATLSRDIHELGLVKTSEGYATPGSFTSEPQPPAIERLLREFGRDVRQAQNQLVLKTAVGSAQPVAVALDAAGWDEVVGTIAGDDTVLIICPDRKQAQKLALRIRGMFV
ncbi:MAG TPA: ArgR family transcriptional regulator [Terriglobales bacterium]|nr:ArgR family transcriptional regulator [Terriglobales bacterium]